MHFDRVVLPADARAGFDLAGHSFGIAAVGLDQQRGFHVRVQAQVISCFHAGQRGPVHQLQRDRDDPGLQDGGDRLRGLIQVVKLSHGGAGALGVGDQPQQGFGDHAQGALGAGEQPNQVITCHVLDRLAARPQDPPIRQHDRQAQDVIPRDAVFEAARASRVAGDVPADGRMPHAAGVRRVEQVHAFHRGLQVGGDDARLDMDDGVLPVDLQYAVHPGQREHQPTLHGDCAGGQAGTHPAGDDGQLQLVRQPQHLADLFGGVRQDDDLRQPFLEGGVVAVGRQVFRR